MCQKAFFKQFLLAVVCLVLLVAVLLPTAACASQSVKISSAEAVLMSEDGQILLEKNAQEKRPIASMTKIMTLLCIYDAVEEGKISLEDNVVASSRAASMGGSQVFLQANGSYTANSLVKSIIVCSANDSCVAMAEHISGSVENFVDAMNHKAQQLGLVATHFENCTGLPHISQFSCAMDVAVMMSHLIKHPHYFSCAGIWMEDFVHPGGRVTGMTNTNKLVRFYEGCDGGKTGYTSEAMHCLAATAKRGDTRVIAVVVAAPDSKTRFREVSELFNFAFANFCNTVYLRQNNAVQSVEVSGGKQSNVDVAPAQDLCRFGKKGQTYQVEVVAQQLQAPVQEGQKAGVAHLLDQEGNVVQSVDLVAVHDVAAKTFWDYVQQIAG